MNKVVEPLKLPEEVSDDDDESFESQTNESLFLEGFLPYMNSANFADCVVKVGKKEYRLHRLILAHSSEFFERAFLGDFKEGKENYITLNYEDKNNVFPIVLEYVYGGKLKINPQNMMHILQMSDLFLMGPLLKLVVKYMKSHITKTNALEVLREAVQINSGYMIDQAVVTIAKYFGQCFVESDVSCLPFEYFLKLLATPWLMVREEVAVYNCVKRYISKHPELSLFDRGRLYGFVRYRWIKRDFLEEIEANKEVPREFLVHALLAKLKDDDVLPFRYYSVAEQQMVLDPMKLRSMPRHPYATRFEFTHDYDGEGIIHYIGTCGGTKEWSNPGLDDRISLTSSSIEKGRVSDIINIEPRQCWTEDVPASWFCVDLGPHRRVKSSHYTIRHGGIYRSDSLRNWDLQGSIDGKIWILLKKHVGDTHLVENFSTFTWPINTKIPVRFLRILQTGHNSSNHNFLCMSGFEIYGELYENEVIKALDDAFSPDVLKQMKKARFTQ